MHSLVVNPTAMCFSLYTHHLSFTFAATSRLRLCALLVLGLLVIESMAMPHAQPRLFEQWSKLPSSRLIDMGHRFLDECNLPDSALACSSIVEARYHSDMDEADKRMMIDAMFIKWYVYFNYYFDYSKAYESLMRADDVAQPFPDQMRLVTLYFGNMFQTLGDIGHSNSQYRISAKYFRSCLMLHTDSAGRVASVAMTNLITIGHQLGQLAALRPYWAHYLHLAHKRGDTLRVYNQLLYTGSIALSAGRYAQAQKAFERQVNVVSGQSVDNQRLRFIALTCLSKSLEAQNRWQDSKAVMRQAERLAESCDLKDARLEAYSHLQNISHRLHDAAAYEGYRNKYITLKDSLLTYHQLMMINGQYISYQMKKYEDQRHADEQRRQVERVVVVAVLCVLLVILAFAYVIYRKNLRLKRSNEMLYRRTTEMLSCDEELSRQSRLLQQQVESLRQQPRAVMATSFSKEADEKYRGSYLDDESKMMLKARIKDVMENSVEIFSPDFSAEKLAELVGTRYKYVSQVINEQYHRNFYSFLNEYRIKEACKRIGDESTYRQFTLEAISKSVGFKSRSTFVAAFKAFTGLTPSEYLRIRRQQGGA